MGVTFAQAVSDYVGHHLPSRNCSAHTIRSYCNGLVSFMEFAEAELGKGVSAIEPDDITFDLGVAYVSHLKEKGLSESSVNQRLACIKAFMGYLAKRNLAFLQAKESIAGVERQKEKAPMITWMTTEEVKTLLSIPDATCGSGLRDLALLAILYDSAARVQEACDLDIGDVDLRTRTVTLTGKGQKTRIVPLSAATANIIKKHIAGIEAKSREVPLFTNRQGTMLTPSGVQWIIDKYVTKARDASDGKLLDKKITPHVFRHSKAMHMLEAGVELIYIRDFLGHKSVVTTEVYAKASPEAKRKAIEGHSQKLNLTPKRISARKEASIIEKVKAIGKANG